MMKIITIRILTLLLQILKLILLAGKGIFFIGFWIFSYSWHYANKLKRLLYIKLYKWKKQSELVVGSKKLPKLDPVVVNNSSIVGQTKTEFIKEAPKMREIEPFKSEPLDMIIEPADYEEEPDLNPDDYLNQIDESLKQEIEEEEAERIAIQGNYMPEEQSSGVSIEQLSETYNTLKKLNPTPQEENKAADVLYNIIGTTMYDFYMTQDECTYKAKQIMERKRSEGEPSVVSESLKKFDINKFI
ncbi:hypothetical protein [Dysgonomonas sp. ZJ709]|uniref:hypothetical protein n=1 Tax=Dysgonomonas sp. ZJ709 TaxID=2709797 RepID=UPI0013EB89C4|nr:hypothetical protein [Dysgonomonas sp. ZJ709]